MWCPVALWRDEKFGELARELTYSPAQKRHEQIAAASVLLDEAEAGKSYPWEFVLYRLTGYRPKEPVEYTLSGEALRADLSAFIEFISDTLAIPADGQGESVLTLEDVTKQFGVSTKTIQRWRRQGLVAQRYVFADGRRRLGFLKSSVEKFGTSNAQRVASAASFRQLSEREKEFILRRARRMARREAGAGRAKEIARRIAQKLGRSVETIRYTLKKWDREHPDAAIFPVTGDPIRTLDQQIITACFDRGVSVECLAKRYCRTRSSIYRVVTQEKARRLKLVKVEWIANPLFEHPEARTIILEVLPKEAVTKAAEAKPPVKDFYVGRWPKDLPAYLAGALLEPPLAGEIETDLARRMNYAKFEAARRIAALDVEGARSTDIADIEALLAQAGAIKNQLIQANLRVAIHVARKHQRPGLELMELMSDAAVWLMRAVDTFDFARGVRLSTYASWSMMKNFARDRAEALTRRDRRLVTGQEEVLAEIGGREEMGLAEQIDGLFEQRDLTDVIGMLPERERELVMAHYGLDQAHLPLSLAELGARMGITKSRVRQLETRALRKLRRLLEERRGAGTDKVTR